MVTNYLTNEADVCTEAELAIINAALDREFEAKIHKCNMCWFSIRDDYGNVVACCGDCPTDEEIKEYEKEMREI